MLTIHINNLPPMPRNRSHSIFNNRLTKTSLCREFEKDLKDRLEYFVEPFAELKTEFSKGNFYLKAHYSIFTPKEQLFTKEGKVSQRATDLDAHKVMQDVICAEIGIDDKFIRDVRYESPVSLTGNWDYVIRFCLQPVEALHG